MAAIDTSGGYQMATATLSIQAGPKFISDAATDDLFGGNIILHRDAANPGSYSAGAQALGLTSLRYPGGTESEARFDLKNPNGTKQWFYEPKPGPNGEMPWMPKTIPLSTFIDHCDAADQSMIFVMPTVRWAGTTRDASGNRHEAVDEALVRSFTLDLLKETVAKGVPLDAIELGNEWWVDGSQYWGEDLSAVEYGRIASRLAVVIDKAIDDFASSGNLPDDWERPDIVVQTGPRIEQRFVTPEGERIPSGYTGPVTSSTELIFREFNTDAEQRAVTGIVMHDYTSGPYENITGFRYKEFDLWDKLAATDPDFVQAQRYVTEWNVKNGNDDLGGLMQANALVAMMAQMMRNGVDHAWAWPVQHGTTNSLTHNTGAWDEPWLGLSAGGEALRMMSESLPGLSLMNVTGEPSDVDVTAFGSDKRVVLFIANETGRDADVTLDVSRLVGGYTHAWGTLLGSASGDPRDPNLIPTITNLTAASLVSGGRIQVQLSPYELLKVEFTLAATGVTVAGYVGNDQLVGSAYNDVVKGDLGADRLQGQSGNDRLMGEGGSDNLKGDAGADHLDGGEGADHLYGGDGGDTIIGGTGSDRVAGNAGQDKLYGGGGSDTLWGDEDNDVIWGGDANDALYGGYGADTLYGEAGDDLLRGGAGSDALYGGLGADRIEGGDLDDLLFGDHGNDRLLGDAGADKLFGGLGSDSLLGGLGDDGLSGGVGADTLDGGAGIDVVDYSGAPGIVVADLQSPSLNKGEAKGDVYLEVESIRGSSHSDRLWGNGAGNTLWGQDGQDRLAGRGGNDVLFGGNGGDTFEFRKGWQVDRIADFRDDLDTIVLDDFAVRSVGDAMRFATQSGSDVVFSFGGGDRLIVGNITLAALQDDLVVA